MDSTSPLDKLAKKLQTEWPNIRAAQEHAAIRWAELEQAIGAFGSHDRSVVIFGSLARGERTQGSDIDWTLLVDGKADPFHLETTRDIRAALTEAGEKAPGRTGVFANMVFSHDLIHQIGGEEDTNANTTRRILLLLEGRPLGAYEAYERVVSGILTRYFREDHGFLGKPSEGRRVPHFLLNDVARYWRTMAVDFAQKQRERGEGFALRNIKLRFSRKLLFIAGLLACFSFQLEMEAEEREELFLHVRGVQPIIDWFRPRLLQRTPLEWVASALLPRPDLHRAAKGFFSAYDQFLGILNDESTRTELEAQKEAEWKEGSAFARAREQSHLFRAAIREIFLQRGNPIGDLTIDYGVF